MDAIPSIAPNLNAPVAARKDMDAVNEAAREFEGMIIGQLLEPMWAGVKTDGAFGGGTGETVFRSLMIQEMGKSIAANGGVGLSDEIARTMLQMQEARAK